MSDRPPQRPDASPGGFADLTVKNDVEAELKLDPRAWPFLERLVASGGEGAWHWNIPKAMADMVCDLIEAGIVIEREHVRHAMQVKPDRITIKITDKGRNVLETHRKRAIVASKVQAIEA